MRLWLSWAPEVAGASWHLPVACSMRSSALLLGCSPAVVAPWECIVLLNPQLVDSYDTSAVSFWIKPKKEGLRA
ncbi:hypothetical protein, partial [Mesorhizobium sp.]|uniref:hypothetical protein n=1 Tax=Mesorhizobium sp. TaxID=1871066 RepID=UPI0025BC6A71